MPRIISVVIIAVGLLQPVWTQRNQASVGIQAQWAADLTKPNTPLDTKVEILKAIKSVPIQHRTPDVLQSLLQAAENIRRERIEENLKNPPREIVASGDGHANEDISAYNHAVFTLLQEYRDPKVISALLFYAPQYLGTMDALADFGEDVFLDVMSLDREDPTAAMMILERMLERRSVRKPLSPASRNRIIGLAQDRLTKGPQEEHVVSGAINLAMKTGEPTLIERVKRLATDVRAAQELGVWDPEDQQRVRIAATEALK